MSFAAPVSLSSAAKKGKYASTAQSSGESYLYYNHLAWFMDCIIGHGSKF